MEGDIEVKRFNFDEFLWFIVLFLLDLFLLDLVITNKVNFYIGNNMTKYIYFAITSISIIAIFQLKNVLTPKSAVNIKIKLLPIILAIILGVISIRTHQTFKHFELNNELKENKISNIDKQFLLEYEIKNKNVNLDNNIEDNSNKHFGKPIIINDSNPMVLEDIRMNPEKYLGKELEIVGFVCKEDYLNKNQCIIERLIMNCCAADSKAVGIIGEYDKVNDLHENDYVVAKGKIRISKIQDDNNVSHYIPVIGIEKLRIENSK